MVFAVLKCTINFYKMIADGDYKVTVRYIQWPGPNAQCRGRAIQDLQASE